MSYPEMQFGSLNSLIIWSVCCIIAFVTFVANYENKKIKKTYIKNQIYQTT